MPQFAVYCSQASYWRHVAPIVQELRQRGVGVDVWGRIPGQPWGVPLVNDHDLAETVIVGSAIDAQRAQDRSVIYVEHGAGQTYLTDDPGLRFGYAGGPQLEHVGLFLCPSPRVARRWAQAYPTAAVRVVGDPALDQHAVKIDANGVPADIYRLGPMTMTRSRRAVVNPSPPTVVVTSHWACGVCPETQPALPHFWPAIPALRDHLAEQGIELVGHAHPRIAARLARDWAEIGVRYEPDPDVVLSTARLLVFDNTSLGYEAAALDVPTLAMNSPDYRRDVHHQLRFWSHVPGLQVDEPHDLCWAVDLALDDGPEARSLRWSAALYAYPYGPGGAASRAVDEILGLVPHPRRRARMAEVRGHLEEMLDRLGQLGATDLELDDFKDLWAAAGTNARNELRHMNDTLLKAAIIDARISDEEEGQE